MISSVEITWSIMSASIRRIAPVFFVVAFATDNLNIFEIFVTKTLICQVMDVKLRFLGAFGTALAAIPA